MSDSVGTETAGAAGGKGWTTADGGTWVCAGAAGTITGGGATCAISGVAIIDPAASVPSSRAIEEWETEKDNMVMRI